MPKTKDVAFDVSKILWGCTSNEGVEAVFKEYGILDPKEKIDRLRLAMQVEDTFDAPTAEPLTPEQEYADELCIFVEGSWRLLTV